MRGVTWSRAVTVATIAVGTLAGAYAQTSDVPETPAIYVLVGKTPWTARSATVEIPLGATRSFTIANAAIFRIGTAEPFPLQKRPATIRWSLEPAVRGVGITPSGVVSVTSN